MNKDEDCVQSWMAEEIEKYKERMLMFNTPDMERLQDYLSTPVETNDKYNITIKEIDRGYIVEVGCKSFAFDNKQIMMNYLNIYLNDREGSEEKFNKGEFFS